MASSVLRLLYGELRFPLVRFHVRRSYNNQYPPYFLKIHPHSDLKAPVMIQNLSLFFFLSKKIGTLFLSVIILLIGFLKYFRSGFLILIRPLLKSIIKSKFLTKFLPKMNWSDSSKFSTSRKLILRSRPPMWRTVIGVLAAT